MNRESLNSASADVGVVMASVVVNPRPASDPGDDNSDLGSDAGWAYTMGSDSGDDQQDSDLDTDADSESYVPSKLSPQNMSSTPIGSIDVDRYEDKPENNSLVGSSVDHVHDNIANFDTVNDGRAYDANYEDDGVADVDAIDIITDEVDQVRARNDINAVNYIDREDFTDGPLALSPPGISTRGSKQVFAAPLQHSMSEPCADRHTASGPSGVVTYEDDEDSDALAMISLIHGYNGVSKSSTRRSVDGGHHENEDIGASMSASAGSSTMTAVALAHTVSASPSRGVTQALTTVDDIDNGNVEHSGREEASSQEAGTPVPPWLTSDESFSPQRTSSSSQSSYSDRNLSNSLHVQIPEKTSKVASLRRFAGVGHLNHQGSQRLAANGFLSHLHNHRISRDRNSGGCRVQPRSGSESWGRSVPRIVRQSDSRSQDVFLHKTDNSNSATFSSATAAELGPFWGPMLASTSHEQSNVSGCSTSVPTSRSVLSSTDAGIPSVSSVQNSSLSSSLETGSSPGLSRPSPATKQFSFLECVVEMLKGAECLKRRNIIMISETRIWLAPDMFALECYSASKKSTLRERHLLPRVRKLRATDREISIVFESKKTLDIIFRHRDVARLWLSGLCCLVPTRATVRSRYKNLEHRENYDPLQDSWNGKLLSSRKCFDEYILLGSIGRGAFGKVKLALSRENRQFYAVKVLSKAMMRKQNRNTAFDRVSQKDAHSLRFTKGSDSVRDATMIADISEIAIMKKLNHPNIVSIRGVFDDVENDRLYIVVEFVSRGPVMNSSRLTGAQQLDEARARMIFVDVLAGLQYMHANGVVHRDLKPENLLEAGDKSVKISDFGAAKYYPDGSSRGSIDGEGALQTQRTTVGTPAFTAPELCLSEKSPQGPAKCFAADIWSLGATLYYIVYGRAPFLAKSVFEMYDAICTKPLAFPDFPEVSRSLQDLIAAMMTKCPEKRASFDDIFQSPWLRDHGDTAERVDELRRRHGRSDMKISLTADDIDAAVVNASIK